MTDEIEVESTEPVEQIENEVEQEVVATESESSPDSEENHEQKSNGVQKRINELTAQRYEEKRAKEEAEKRASELEAKLAAQESAKATSALVPPSTDLQYEDPTKYNQEMAQYVSQLNQQTLQEQQRLRQEADNKALQEAQQAELQRSFIESAEKANIGVDDAFKSAEILMQRGVQGTALENALLQHPQKAALMHHLAQNPHEYDELVRNNHPIKAWEGLKGIESKALKKKISNSPEPIPDIKSNSGKIEDDGFDGMFKNAQFD